MHLPASPVARFRGALVRALGLWLRSHFATAESAIEKLGLATTTGPRVWVLRRLVKSVYLPDVGRWLVLADTDRPACLESKDTADVLFDYLQTHGASIEFVAPMIQAARKARQTVEYQLLAYLPTAKANLSTTLVDIGAKKLASRRRHA